MECGASGQAPLFHGVWVRYGAAVRVLFSIMKETEPFLAVVKVLMSACSSLVISSGAGKVPGRCGPAEITTYEGDALSINRAPFED